MLFPPTDLSVDAASDLIDPGFICISRLLPLSCNNLIIGRILVERKLLSAKIGDFYRVFKLGWISLVESKVRVNKHLNIS